MRAVSPTSRAALRPNTRLGVSRVKRNGLPAGFTLQGKWWTGGALRYYFVDNLLTSFNPTASVVSSVPSISNEGTAVAFGCTVALVAGACPRASALVLPQ